MQRKQEYTASMETDYREMLRSELEFRNSRNVAYSLRAFARSLNLTAPHLSAILSGKKGLSPASATRISDCLSWDLNRKKLFLDLVMSRHSRNPKDKAKATQRLENYQRDESYHQLDLKNFQLISEWHHFAILHLFETKEFRSDPSWIAKRLGLSITDVQNSLDKMSQLGLVDCSASVWKLKKKYVSTPTVPSEAIRRHHHQILHLAGEALESQSIEMRDFSSITMSLDSAKIPEAKDALKEFRRKFCSKMDRGDSKDEVYCLSLQFFRLSCGSPNSLETIQSDFGAASENGTQGQGTSQIKDRNRAMARTKGK